MALHTIEICAGVGMLGEGLRVGLSHMGIPLRTVCYLEREAYPAAVLASRIQEQSLDAAPIWSDLLTFDAGRWAGAVDGIVAGFPCQDLSLAGRRAGLDGKRSGLFFNIIDIAHACGAWFLFLENVSGIASATASVVDEAEGDLQERAAARVLGELADRGWNAEWLTLSASEVGASHGRERWFCFAWRELADTTSPDGPGMRSGGAEKVASLGADRLHLGNPDLSGREELRPQPDRAGSGNEAGVSDGAMADSERTCDRAQEQAANPDRTQEAQRPTDQHGGLCGACVRPVADTSSTGQQGRELGRALHGNRGGQEAHGSVEQFRRPLFAPGPADPRWRDIITRWPEHAPALEPDFRGMVDGMAFAMDESRDQRLKCVGNGVVALQAGLAFIQLARRAGFGA